MITVQHGDITSLRIVDAIVSAANGCGIAGAGVAGAISKAAGSHPCSDGLPYNEHIRAVAKAARLYDEGQVFVTESGGLVNHGITAVMHAVTMKFPGGPTSYNIVDTCLNNIGITAVARGFKAIAVPGLGIGIGNLDAKLVARSTVQICRKFSDQLDIIIIGIDKGFVDACRQANADYKASR